MGPSLQPLIFGEPRPANLGELESELSALWRSLAHDPASEEAVIRACALTLLVCVESEEAGREVSNLISDLTVQNPCRAVVMVAQPDATPPEITASISAHCHLPAAGEKQVCCEQITVWARGEGVRDLDNVVVPLTVPGLPVYLWWRAGRFDPPPYFSQICRVTRRVLVDSARFPDPHSDLVGLAREVQRLSAEVAFSDLNWARLMPWCELIAQGFDAADARPYLDCLNQVRIEYERDSPRLVAQGAQALLLTAWLASRLIWEPERRQSEPGSDARLFFFKSAHGTVAAELVPRKFEGSGSGVCVAIRMQADGTPPATFSLFRGTDGRSAVTRVEIAGRPPIERTVRVEVLNETELVNEELKTLSRDPVYEETLAMLARLME